MKILSFRASLILCFSVYAISVFGQSTPTLFPFRLQPFLTGLDSPVFVRHSGQSGTNRLFIVQQRGIIKLLQPDTKTPTVFIDLSSKVSQTGDERGLLGMTVHRQFNSNGKFYVNYTRASDGATVIAEYSTLPGNINQGDINSERILLTIPQPFPNHNGGMIEFGPGDFLYIGMGDGGSANDPGNRAQDPSQLLGKMLRIDLNVLPGSTVPYQIPFDNPFQGPNTTRCDGGSTTPGNTCQEIWAIGLRNPWRWSFDRSGDRWLMAGDVGEDGIEEINAIFRKNNYGWRVFEGNQCTNLDPGLCNPNNYTMPIFQYSHTNGRCSVVGGYVYRGKQGVLGQGAYIFGDYCSGEIWRLGATEPVLLADTPHQIVSFGEDEDGELYVVYSNGQIDKIVRVKASADFDGDLKTDLSVFRPSAGAWYILNSSNGSFRAQQFGISSDIPVPEDYDGDNITDIGVFRPADGMWYFLRSSNNTLGALRFGENGDIPVAADYDGDAKADVTVFRPSTGVWTRLNSFNSRLDTITFGTNGDIPVAGDFGGDGKADITVFRPSTGAWYRLSSGNGAFSGFQFGTNGDVPVQGDYDGDNTTDFAVFRPSNSTWYILRSSDAGFQAVQWGTTNDIPVVGDYDGDAKEDVGVFRPSNGTWYILRSSNGSLLANHFGQNGDLPAPRYDAP